MVHCTAKKLLTMSVFSIKLASLLPCIIDITEGMAIACTVFIFIGYFFIFTEFWLYFEITLVGFLRKTDFFFLWIVSLALLLFKDVPYQYKFSFHWTIFIFKIPPSLWHYEISSSNLMIQRSSFLWWQVYFLIRN